MLICTKWSFGRDNNVPQLSPTAPSVSHLLILSFHLCNMVMMFISFVYTIQQTVINNEVKPVVSLKM